MLARPLFGLRWLAPLQRLADAHPRMYWGCSFAFQIVPNFVCYLLFVDQRHIRGICNLVFNCSILILALGFLSSKRYNLDRIAAKHVLLSFRFTIIAALHAMDVALTLRLVFTSDKHLTEVIALGLMVVIFCLCILLDCSPHLPPAVQIFISVCAHEIARQMLAS